MAGAAVVFMHPAVFFYSYLLLLEELYRGKKILVKFTKLLVDTFVLVIGKVATLRWNHLDVSLPFSSLSETSTK